MKFPSERAAIDAGVQIGGTRAAIPIRSERAPALSGFLAGLMIVAAVQAGTPTAPYVVADRYGRPIAMGRIVEAFSELLQRGLDLKAYPIGATAFRVGRQRKWGGLRRAARALSRALHVSRAQAARRIIHDYRHLIQK